MAKTKTSRKKPAKKTTARRKKISSTDAVLSPRQAAKVIKKLKKLSLPPSHPSRITGPALELGYEASLPPREVKVKKKTVKKATRKKR